MNPEKRILQIIPATGWSAVYAIERDDGSYQPKASLLACWALVEADKYGEIIRDVVGFDAGEFLDGVEDNYNFLGYIGPGESADIWCDEAVAHGRRLKRQEEIDEAKRGK